jgi:hypothetical protein
MRSKPIDGGFLGVLAHNPPDNLLLRKRSHSEPL